MSSNSWSAKMVKAKGETKKSAIKSNWDEDDISVTPNNVTVVKKKKSANAMKDSTAAVKKSVKDGKITKKVSKKGAKKASDDFGASLNKLKEIDPEFYKVNVTSCTFCFILLLNYLVAITSFFSRSLIVLGRK